MITEDLLITSKDLIKWLNREITEDDEELCIYLSNAVKNQYKYHKEIDRLNNIIKYIKKYCYKHEEYEITKLIEQLENANIEWLKKEVITNVKNTKN